MHVIDMKERRGDDVVKQLRDMADAIEKGEIGDVSTLLIGMNVEINEGYMEIHCVTGGRDSDSNDCIVLAHRIANQLLMYGHPDA